MKRKVHPGGWLLSIVLVGLYTRGAFRVPNGVKGLIRTPESFQVYEWSKAAMNLFIWGADHQTPPSHGFARFRGRESKINYKI